MRRGDCCCLKWKDVDLEQRFITVKTTKTRQTVTIPIFPALHKELNQLRGNGSKYVFPEAAAMYRRNPDGITLRVRHVLAQAGFVDGETLDLAENAVVFPDSFSPRSLKSGVSLIDDTAWAPAFDLNTKVDQFPLAGTSSNSTVPPLTCLFPI